MTFMVWVVLLSDPKVLLSDRLSMSPIPDLELDSTEYLQSNQCDLTARQQLLSQKQNNFRQLVCKSIKLHHMFLLPIFRMFLETTLERNPPIYSWIQRLCSLKNSFSKHALTLDSRALRLLMLYCKCQLLRLDSMLQQEGYHANFLSYW